MILGYDIVLQLPLRTCTIYTVYIYIIFLNFTLLPVNTFWLKTRYFFIKEQCVYRFKISSSKENHKYNKASVVNACGQLITEMRDGHNSKGR